MVFEPCPGWAVGFHLKGFHKYWPGSISAVEVEVEPSSLAGISASLLGRRAGLHLPPWRFLKSCALLAAGLWPLSGSVALSKAALVVSWCGLEMRCLVCGFRFEQLKKTAPLTALVVVVVVVVAAAPPMAC